MSQHKHILQPAGTSSIERSAYAAILANISHLVPVSVCSLRVDARLNSSSCRYPDATPDIKTELVFTLPTETGEQAGYLCLTLIEQAGQRSVFLAHVSGHMQQHSRLVTGRQANHRNRGSACAEK